MSGIALQSSPTASTSPSAGFDYPVTLKLADQPVLVVGAGRVAAGKVRRLVPTGAIVTVVAPDAVPEIAASSTVTWHRRRYQDGEAAQYRLVITATGSPAIDGRVFADAEAAGVLVNSADDPRHCRFILPAVARPGSGGVTIAIGTSGASPALASWLKRQLESQFDADLDDLLALLVQVRGECRAFHGTTEHGGWADALSQDLVSLVRTDRPQALRIVRKCLGLPHPGETQ